MSRRPRVYHSPGGVTAAEHIRREVEALQAFLSAHGRMPRAFGPASEARLGVRLLRLQARYRLGDMSRRYVDALEAVPGWRWLGPRERRRAEEEATFRRHVSELGAFVSAHGRHPDPSSWLASWADGCRVAHARGQLAPARAALLEALPGWAWPSNRRAVAHAVRREDRRRTLLGAIALGSAEAIRPVLGVSADVLYREIRSAVRDGLIETVPGGRREPRIYRLTEAGQAALSPPAVPATASTRPSP